MIRVHVVIGDSGTGKSALLRALTGAGRRKTEWLIATKPRTRGAVLSAYIRVCSLQEGKLIKPKEFLKEIEALKTTPTDIVIALRNHHKKFDANAYLEAFVSAGWILESVACLSECASPHLTQVKNLYQLPLSQTQASNLLAADVRSKWAWM